MFRNKYGFKVFNARVSEDNEKPVQQQVNWHVANFIHDEDREEGLLIVYYNGHGLSVYAPGQVIPTR